MHEVHSLKLRSCRLGTCAHMHQNMDLFLWASKSRFPVAVAVAGGCAAVVAAVAAAVGVGGCAGGCAGGCGWVWVVAVAVWR